MNREFWSASAWPLCIALLAVAALRLLPFGAFVTTDWAELSIRQQLTVQRASDAQTSIDLLDSAATKRDVDAWIAANPAAVRAAGDKLEQEYRDAISFSGGDGRTHLYIGGADSYYWLRLAWLRLQNGTACDRIEDGRCIDALADAPIGMDIRYSYSPHVFAIAVTHRLLAWIDPGLPLENSALALCFLLSMLAAITAFLLARRLSNPFGGAIAAFLVGGNAYLLQRTIGADNDVWVLGLPLFVAWSVLRAFDAARWSGRTMFAFAAGAALGLLAAAWAGWWLFYLIALGSIGVASLRLAVGSGARSRDAVLSGGAIICGVTAGLLLVAVALRVPVDLREPWQEILRIAGFADGHTIDTAPWPNTFALVNELAASDLWRFFMVFGPLAAITGAVYLPALLARRQTGAAAVLFALWLVATAILAAQAARYLVLLVVPLGILSGAGVGWILEQARHPNRMARRAITAGLLIAVVMPTLYQSYRSQRLQAPDLTDAWADSLKTLKRSSDPAAILHVWWDYGHWAKYFAERRTTSDGASLRTRTQHWLARALAVSNPAESLKLLHMVDCGAATDPDDGARLRPFEMLLKWGFTEASAYRAILELTHGSDGGSATYFDSLDLAPPRRAALLAAMTCAPSDGYLMLSTEMMANLNWLAAGFWNPFRAGAVEFARNLPQDQAIARMEKEFNILPDVARPIYDEALGVRNEEERKAFAAVDARLIVTKWQPCFPDGDALRCPLAVVDADGRRWREVRFDPAQPSNTVISVDGAPDGRLVPVTIQTAWPERLTSTVPAETPTANLALLVDPVGRRMFVGTPGVVQSLLTRLVLLDGRYDSAFEKVQDRLAIDGNRVTTWRIRWDLL